MKNTSLNWFLAFVAVFIVLAAYVFWGTWSIDYAPVMPDHPIVHPPWWMSEFAANFINTGKFVPGDLMVFLGGPYVWQELKYVFSVFCAALAMVYFCRGRKLSRAASYGAGLMLSFSGYWLTLFSAGHYGWFQWMTYGVFAFGLIDRAFDKNELRHWVLLGSTLAWGSFYQSDLWLLFTVFTAAYFLFRAVPKTIDIVKSKDYQIFKGIGVALLAFLLIGASSFYSAFTKDLSGRDEQISRGETVSGAKNDEEKRWIFTTNWSMGVEDTKEFFVGSVHGDTSCQLTQWIGRAHGKDIKPYTGSLGRPYGAKEGNYRQHSLYIGTITCLLALLGLTFSRKNRTVPFFAVAAIMTYLFSLGRNFECVYRIVYALPFGDYLRAPVKWHHLTEFSVVVLAAFGVEACWNYLGGLKNRSLRWMIPVAVILGVLLNAANAKLYCAPVFVGEARAQQCAQDFNVLRTEDFSSPQIANMVRAKKIVAQAKISDNMYLVSVLKPFGEKPVLKWRWNTQTILGVISLIATLSVCVISVVLRLRARVRVCK